MNGDGQTIPGAKATPEVTLPLLLFRIDQLVEYVTGLGASWKQFSEEQTRRFEALMENMPNFGAEAVKEQNRFNAEDRIRQYRDNMAYELFKTAVEMPSYDTVIESPRDLAKRCWGLAEEFVREYPEGEKAT